MTPTTTEQLKIQKSMLDLDTFEDVLLVKTGTFIPAKDQHEALHRVGNDSAKFLEVINDGLRTEAQRALRESNEGWMAEDEDGKTEPFTGIPADRAKVNALVLNMAKTVFGYEKSLSADAKKAAKEQAMTLIKGNDVIKNGLKTSSAAKD